MKNNEFGTSLQESIELAAFSMSLSINLFHLHDSLHEVQPPFMNVRTGTDITRQARMQAAERGAKQHEKQLRIEASQAEAGRKREALKRLLAPMEMPPIRPSNAEQIELFVGSLAADQRALHTAVNDMEFTKFKKLMTMLLDMRAQRRKVGLKPLITPINLEGNSPSIKCRCLYTVRASSGWK